MKEETKDFIVDFWVNKLLRTPDMTEDTKAVDRVTAHMPRPDVAMEIIKRTRAVSLPGKEKIEAFAKILRQHLDAPTQIGEEWLYGVINDETFSLRVDYEAQGLLRFAAQEAGIGAFAFPFKTCMGIYRDTVRYDGVQIFPPPFRRCLMSVWIADYQKVSNVRSDGTTVWVNGPFDMLGRFGAFGIDVHRDVREHTHYQDLFSDCGEPSLLLWRVFQVMMYQYYKIMVTDEHIPLRLRREALDELGSIRAH